MSPKQPQALHGLADRAERLAIDVPLSPSGILREGLGESDFRVLEILLHKKTDAGKCYWPKGLPYPRIR